MEGARIEKGAMIAPGTVVPPGRLIPSNTLWAGNPCEFVKDLDIGERWANYTLSYVYSHLGEITKNEYTLWSNAYLKKESSQDDAFPEGNIRSALGYDVLNMNRVKTYIF